jgi:DNA-binding NtrC family response regulator
MQPRMLLVLSPACRTLLLGRLDGKGFQIISAASYDDACEKLAGSLRYDLLFVDADLTGGRWQDLLETARSFGMVSAAVVCARLGDHQLWADVLQSGAYDLLTEPYEDKEIDRIIEGALQSSQLRRA